MSFAPGTANAESHFCAGDAADKAGIRRAGGALHGGHYVARNIHQSITEGVTGRKAEYTERGEPRAVIGLAIGRKAVASGPQGTKSGEDVMRDLFGDDLGFESNFSLLPALGVRGSMLIYLQFAASFCGWEERRLQSSSTCQCR